MAGRGGSAGRGSGGGRGRGRGWERSSHNVELDEQHPMWAPALTDEDLAEDPVGHRSGYVAVIGKVRVQEGEDGKRRRAGHMGVTPGDGTTSSPPSPSACSPIPASRS